MRRYVIIGAGAIGCAIGGRLAQAGRDVVLVARGEHLQALRGDGLRIRTPDEDVRVPVIAVGDPAEVVLTTEDVLVVATKTQQLQAAVAAWADEPVRDPNGSARNPVLGTAGELLPVMTATNGVAAEDLAARYFTRVLGICVWLPAARLEPGEVILRSTPISGVLHLGRVPAVATTEDDRALLAEIAADWSDAGYAVPTPPDVMPWKYRKLIGNLGNVFEALLGDRDGSDDLRAAADAEARAVFDAARVAYTPDAEERAVRADGFRIGTVPGIEGHVGGSTWQSLTRGTGDIETDYLNGEIAALAHRHGLTAPINATLARLGRAAVRSGARPGEMSVDELAEQLGLSGDAPSA